MSLSVNYEKVNNAEEAYSVVKEHITPEYVEKFKVQTEIDYNSNDPSINASGKGFELNLSFGESACQVDLDVSFFLKPVRGKVLSTIEKELKRVL